MQTKAEYALIMQHFFELVCVFLLYFESYKLIPTKLIAGIEKYNITAENMYN
jgi:hypothetical protein